MTRICMRRAVPSDAEELSEFAARLFRETYADTTNKNDLDHYISKSFHLDQQKAEIVDPSGVTLLLTLDDDSGVIRGYAHIVAHPHDKTAMLLNRIYIEKDCRGTGLAGRLLDEVSSECRLRGFARLRLSVFEKNTHAIAFYRRNGFRVTGETIFTVGDEVQRDLEMELAIDPA